jgi:hypothetical protein
MNFIRTLCRRLAPLVLTSFGFTCLYIPAAQAGMIAPSTYGQTQNGVASEQRQQLQQFLSRDDISAQLVKMGVDPAEAQARVERLSDQEVATAAERVQQLPAGGDGGIVGAIVFIFLVLLITDLLGVTDVYPFVKKTVR